MITVANENVLNETLFPVTSQEVMNSNYLAIKKGDDIISIMTKQYSLIPNQEVWDAINFGLNYYDARLKEVKMFKGLRTQWTIVFGKEHRTEISVGDVVDTGIRVYNSYDGSKKLTIVAFLERLACTNGMVMDEVSTEWDAMHRVGNIDMEVFPQKLQDIAVQSNEYISNKIQKLSDISVPEEKLLEFVEIFPQKLQEPVLAELSSANTYYDMLNAGTYVMTHIANRMIESNIKLERGLISQVVSMAGLA
jgi:translation initiation factor IF-1